MYICMCVCICVCVYICIYTIYIYIYVIFLVAIDGPFSCIVIITTEFVEKQSLFIVTKFEHVNRMHGQDTGCSNVQTCGT